MATAVPLTLVAVAAFLALVLPAPRGRAGAMLAALVGAPALLLYEVWDVPAVADLRARPELVAAGILGGLLVVALLAALFARRPAWAAVAVVAALPFRLPIEVGAGQPVNLLLPLYLVVGAAGLAWAWRRRRVETPEERAAVADPRPGLVEVLAVGLVVLYAVQSAYSSDAETALRQVAFFYVPFALAFVVLRTVDWSARLLATCVGVLVVLALAFVGVGFYEYATRTVLLNPKVIASNGIQEAFRVNSIFFDPNVYGRFLALVMTAVLAVVLATARRGRAVLGGVVLLVLWAGLLLTLSQTSFLALLTGVLVIGALRWGALRAAGVLAAVVVVGLAILALAPGLVGLDGLDRRSLDAATSGRVDLVEGGARLALERPLQGFGSGSFSREFRRAAGVDARVAVDASHTIPLTIGAEQGAIGLVAYLVLLVGLGVRFLRGARETAARTAVAAMTAGLVVHTMGYAAFLEDPALWVLLAVGCALARAQAPSRERLPRRERRRRRAERASRRQARDAPPSGERPPRRAAAGADDAGTGEAAPGPGAGGMPRPGPEPA